MRDLSLSVARVAPYRDGTPACLIGPRRPLACGTMLDRFKAFWQGVALAPFINLFVRLGISPDAVTLVGTLGVSAGALVCFPQGWLWQGVLIVTGFVFSDLVDGAMARKIGRTDTFGAFLDST